MNTMLASQKLVDLVFREPLKNSPLVGYRPTDGWPNQPFPFSEIGPSMDKVRSYPASNLLEAIETRMRMRKMAANTLSRMVRRIGHSCSEFGHYFMSIQRSNCQGCPDCSCEDGPSIEEAQRDYREMLRSSNSAMLTIGSI